MTTTNNESGCPAEGILRMLSGKWKAQIFKLALDGPLRFNTLLRQLEGSNKQSVATALRELEEAGLLNKIIIRQKPLHIEYHLTPKAESYIQVFRQIESLIPQ